MSESTLKVSDLDFDSIKANLKDFLRAQSTFKDFDFEGSAMSVLLDVLAYNTHYEAMVANQLARELTIETSNNPTVVALHAKRLGYTPRSARAARSSISLEVLNPVGSPGSLTLGKGALFVASSTDGNTYNFVTREPKSTQKDVDGRYIFNDIQVYEGKLKSFRYEYITDAQTSFEIPDDLADTDTLRVFVQPSSTNSARIEYFKVDSLVEVTSTSPVYYLQVNQAGRYEVHFGDDVLGKKPQNSNVITLEYIVTSAEVANNILHFAFNDSIEGNYSNVIMTSSLKSYGGAAKESVDSIRFNAYRNTLTQNRAVTESDYEAIIPQIYPLDSISVWGGERNDPPVYGKIFVAIKPLDSDSILTANDKDFISSTLKKTKSMVTVTPEFVDVDYLYIEPTVVLYIDDTQLNTSTEYLKVIARQAILKYSLDSLERFEKSFRFSKFAKMIDALDVAILSNITSTKMSRRFLPSIIRSDTYTVPFNNPIEAGTVTSSKFKMLGSDLDLYLADSNGILQTVYTENNLKKVYQNNIGTVDYSTGKLVMEAVFFSSYIDYIKITAVPSSPDIISMRNVISVIKDEDIRVSTVIESKNPIEHQFSLTR